MLRMDRDKFRIPKDVLDRLAELEVELKEGRCFQIFLFVFSVCLSVLCTQEI